MDTPPAADEQRSAGAGNRARRPRTAAPVLCGAVLAAVLTALLLPVRPALRLSDEGDTIGYLPLAEGERFTVAYVHSIDGLPIEEDIEVRDGHLVVEATRLRQFGAGMGHIPGEGTGHADGAWWVIEGIGRDIGTELVIRVGAPAVDHRIRTPDDEVRLSPCLAARPVTVEPARAPVLHLLLGGAPEPEC
ncbi:DUF1850 domain-containing protein [Nocardiopsis quinghaiensis]|uniref:DUF1850 domain-containing protein n=1 Tax=Nocardiopsis quinghaiensis TaxID=464995 RepID=UPI00123C36D0|nr:DUF1850 domain-containing protein [Nocardiopsis quinghaiensis]